MYRQNTEVIEIRVRFWCFLIVVSWVFICLLFFFSTFKCLKERLLNIKMLSIVMCQCFLRSMAKEHVHFHSNQLGKLG